MGIKSINGLYTHTERMIEAFYSFLIFYIIWYEYILAYFADLLVKAIDIANLYVTGLKLSKDLDPQECMHGEEFIPIVVYVLIQVIIIVSFVWHS